MINAYAAIKHSDNLRELHTPDYFNRSIATILGTGPGASIGTLARRPDIANTEARMIWEIKPGIPILGPGSAAVQLWGYLRILNDPENNPGVEIDGPYTPGGGYDPVFVPLEPWLFGHVLVFSDYPGILLYYPDTGNTAAIAALAAASMYITGGGTGAATASDNIVRANFRAPDLEKVAAVIVTTTAIGLGLF